MCSLCTAVQSSSYCLLLITIILIALQLMLNEIVYPECGNMQRKQHNKLLHSILHLFLNIKLLLLIPVSVVLINQ